MIWLRSTAAAVVAALAVAAMATPALAHEESSGDITLMHSWSRPAPQGHNGVIYLDIHNKGAAADRLVGASTTVAEKVEFHRSTMKDGIHRMEKVDGIAVPAGGMATLAPGGYHIMLIGLTYMLMAEETFSVTFTFEKAGDITSTVSVETRGGADDGGMAGHGEEH